MLNINDIKEKVKNDKNFFCLALGGKEPFFQEEATKFFRQFFHDSGNDELSHYKFDLLSNKLDEILVALNTLPFMSKKNLVEVFNAEKLTDKDLKQLEKYFKSPSMFSYLLVHFTNFDRRNKAVAFFAKAGFLADFSKGDATSSVLVEAKNHGLSITTETARFLLGYYDNDLFAIRNFLLTLSLFFTKEVSISELSPYLGQSGLDAFLLVRAICENNLSKSLFLLEKLRKNKESPLKFLGLLLWQLRVILQIKHLKEQCCSDWDIRKAVHVYQENYQWMSKVANAFPLSYHANRLSRLIKTDEQLKSSGGNRQYYLLERAIYKTCSKFA